MILYVFHGRRILIVAGSSERPAGRTISPILRGASHSLCQCTQAVLYIYDGFFILVGRSLTS